MHFCINYFAINGKSKFFESNFKHEILCRRAYGRDILAHYMS